VKGVVGSTNPVKIAAARAVLRRVYGDAVCVEACRVGSGVSLQPWGDEETLRGARNRAQAALRVNRATLGIGFEGGLVEVGGRVFTCAWCAVAREDGAMGMAGGAHLLLPPSVAVSVRAGSELGPTMDVLTGLHNTKEHQGAIGILTDGHLDRQSAYEHLLTLALAPLLTPAYYDQRDLTSE
jgi:inosine/xanthosine triphosphatase